MPLNAREVRKARIRRLKVLEFQRRSRWLWPIAPGDMTRIRDIDQALMGLAGRLHGDLVAERLRADARFEAGEIGSYEVVAIVELLRSGAGEEAVVATEFLEDDLVMDGRDWRQANDPSGQLSFPCSYLLHYVMDVELVTAWELAAATSLQGEVQVWLQHSVDLPSRPLS